MLRDQGHIGLLEVLINNCAFSSMVHIAYLFYGFHVLLTKISHCVISLLLMIVISKH